MSRKTTTTTPFWTTTTPENVEPEVIKTTSFWTTTPTTTTTTKPPTTVTTTELDPDMRESVSILESDINKTIENNDKKLKEEQMRLERILHQQQKVQSSTSSERSSYDLAVDFVTPIIETVPEDERIEVIQTMDREFNFDESLTKTNTDQTPAPAIIEERTTKMGTIHLVNAKVCLRRRFRAAIYRDWSCSSN